MAAMLGGVSLLALLAGAAQVRGMVVDMGSKAPLAGAQVTSGLRQRPRRDCPLPDFVRLAARRSQRRAERKD
jgi:hypothetical protein